MRGTRWPTTVSFASSSHGAGFREGSSTIFVSSRPSTSTLVVTNRLLATGRVRLGGGQHRAHDGRVRAAAAEVTAHAGADVVLRGSGIRSEQCDGGQNLARGAEAALRGVVLDERALHAMRGGRGADAFYGADAHA